MLTLESLQQQSLILLSHLVIFNILEVHFLSYLDISVAENITLTIE